MRRSERYQSNRFMIFAGTANRALAAAAARETHGRSGAARLFLGSVADKIIRGAGVPVLLHRPALSTSSEQKVMR
jgi:hypothetical protein